MQPQLILASASPRRKQLLAQIGIDCLVHAMDIDETPLANEHPLAYVQRMAAEKSAAGLARLASPLPILAADTSVVLGDVILGKPDNADHAAAMLRQLSGRSHQVYTAISLRGAQQHGQAVSITEVCFRELSEQEIHAYCQTDEPHDKAGSYALQGKASVFVKSLSGSVSGVIGLPLFETAQLLSAQGINVFP